LDSIRGEARFSSGYRADVGKASDWLREERRKVLGDWVAVCLNCGFAQRYFESSEDDLPVACPQCAGELRSRCPACGARFSSAFAVECEVCGAELRPAEQFGIRIRRSS
jgi:ribosomal protein S27E